MDKTEGNWRQHVRLNTIPTVVMWPSLTVFAVRVWPVLWPCAIRPGRGTIPPTPVE